MANQQKKQPKATRPHATRRHRLMKWLLTKREHGPDRIHQLSLMLACVVAGILALLNTDRMLHTTSSKQLGPNVSQHGWPMVYLNRQGPAPLPMLRKEPGYAWPYPAVKDETRTWSWVALLTDLVVALVFVAATYWVVQRLAGKPTKVETESEALLDS